MHRATAKSWGHPALPQGIADLGDTKFEEFEKLSGCVVTAYYYRRISQNNLYHLYPKTGCDSLIWGAGGSKNYSRGHIRPQIP